jgi:hypothetical protein
MCPYGTLPSSDHMDCLALPEVYLTLQSPLAIGAVTFAVVGIIMTLAVLVPMPSNFQSLTLTFQTSKLERLSMETTL